MARPGKYGHLSLEPSMVCPGWDHLWPLKCPQYYQANLHSCCLIHAIQRQKSNRVSVGTENTSEQANMWLGAVAWTARSLHVSSFISAQDLSITCCPFPSDREWRTKPFCPHHLTSTKTIHEGHHQCLVQKNWNCFQQVHIIQNTPAR